MVDDVQSNRPHTIDGAKVETKRATPREEGGSGKSVKKIFVGGFKDKLEDCDLETFFSAFGAITSAKQVLEKGSDKKLGFGFIEFDDYDAVDKIIISGSTHVINGVRVDVRKALDKNDMGGGFGGGSGGGGRRGGGGGGDKEVGEQARDLATSEMASEVREDGASKAVGTTREATATKEEVEEDTAIAGKI